MKNSCEGSSCSIETQSEQVSGKACGCCSESSQNCPVTGCVDPVELVMDGWKQSFFSAMCELKTELLKEKIRKAWGAQLEKSADAVLEAFGTCWKSVLEKSAAQEQLRSRLSKIMFEK
ncbi:MAG: hypothetical protein HY606_13460 [Planctomycetes bacterium]|nr:hypothetical protein [Planctomycetota bacterium]